nr:hypothetical protein [Bacteroidota bacterium]
MAKALKKETIELLTLIFRVNSRQDKEQVVQEAREHIEVIRLFDQGCHPFLRHGLHPLPDGKPGLQKIS